MPDPSHVVEPPQDYLGFLCERCGQTFSIIGPLDPVEMPADKPMRIGARGPMPAACSHCGHKTDYTVQQLIRFSK
jgi:DNA-directed RNA polymerase subunit RPC12/RpoP